MSNKMVFFDIDGTLFDHNQNKIPESTIYAIEELSKKNIPVAIATGRAPFLFEDIRRQLSIDNYVSFNGSYVVYNNEAILKTPLQQEELRLFTKRAKELNFPLVYLDHEGMRSTASEHHHIFESFQSLKFDHPKADESYFENRDIYQTLIFSEEKHDHHFIDKYEHFDFIRWHEYSTDVLPKGGSKARGIISMTEKLGIPIENVVAFGDALNDIEMLKTVGHGIAMGNGMDEAKNAAKYVTKPIDEDGILYGLKMIGML